MAAFTTGSVLQYCATNSTTESDWNEPISPQTMEIGYQDMDYESGRTADGSMHRNKVGMKRTLKLTYPPMGYADARAILSLVVSDTVTDFYVRYYDPVENDPNKSYRTINVYVGDRTVPVYSTGLQLFNAMSFDLVEM